MLFECLGLVSGLIGVIETHRRSMIFVLFLILPYFLSVKRIRQIRRDETSLMGGHNGERG